jgi:hypothetical protein
METLFGEVLFRFLYISVKAYSPEKSLMEKARNLLVEAPATGGIRQDED